MIPSPRRDSSMTSTNFHHQIHLVIQLIKTLRGTNLAGVNPLTCLQPCMNCPSSKLRPFITSISTKVLHKIHLHGTVAFSPISMRNIIHTIHIIHLYNRALPFAGISNHIATVTGSNRDLLCYHAYIHQ